MKINNEEEKINLSLFRYECSCGAHFKITNEVDDNGIKFCPYCGLPREEMGDSSWDGLFEYVAKEVIS